MATHTIGVGIFIKNADNKILLGRRGPACKRGAGLLALPGGHVDPGESVAAAVLREAAEETGLAVMFQGGYPVPPRDPYNFCGPPFCVPGVLAVTDHLDKHQQRDGEPLNHLTLWVLVRHVGGEPAVVEPDKCDGWRWMSGEEIAAIEGGSDAFHPQYHGTPVPLWRHILKPYLGEF